MRKILLITTAVLLALPMFAQRSQKQVTLTITRTINGVTTNSDTSFYVNDPSEVEGILERMGIDEPRENQTLEKRIVIRDIEEEGQTYTYERDAPHPMIGVYLQDFHDDNENKKGVYVTGITGGSGAQDANMQKGDIILSIEGTEVNSSDDIGDVKQGYKVGDRIDIVFVRDGQRQSANVQLKGKASYSNKAKAKGAMVTRKESKPFLGVVPHTVDRDIVRENNLGGAATRGIFLSEIVENSAAERAGLEEGDVIVEINGEEVEGSNDLGTAIRKAHEELNDEMLITYIRDGRRRTDRATLGSKTYSKKVWVSGDKIDKQKVEEKRAYLGVYLETNSDGGVTVTRPTAGGAAANAGIEANDVIVSIDGDETQNYNALVKVLRAKKPGQRVRMAYRRDGNRKSTMVTLGEKTITKWVVKEKVKNQAIDIDVIINQFEDKAVAEALVKDMENPTLDMPDFTVFPNPSNGEFTLRFTPTEGSPVRIKIFDTQGRVLYQEQLTDFRGMYEKELDISDNPAGMYFLQVTQNGQGMAKQLTVQK
ncbi:MAG: PDZ domain-containing protein [Bacteroidia bacterium]